MELLIVTLYLAFATIPITRFPELPDVPVKSTGSFPRGKQISSLSCAWQHQTFTQVHPHCLSRRWKSHLGPELSITLEGITDMKEEQSKGFVIPLWHAEPGKLNPFHFILFKSPQFK